MNDLSVHPGAIASRAFRAANPRKNSEYQQKHRYGVLPADIKRLKEEQGGLCAISACGAQLGSKFDVDHDHHTGKVRGLLCHRCNLRIGGLDDPEYRQSALGYIEKHQPSNHTGD